MCGGTTLSALTLSDVSGLSPRVRGNQLDSAAHSPPERSIPACAGEPASEGSCHLSITVYPRVCGGTDVVQYRAAHATGLSPRVRGNQSLRNGAGARRGSIPACAGEPTPITINLSGAAVYPRVCGGTLDGIRPRCVVNGLSPRVRGNHRRIGQESYVNRSIPACAGEPRKGEPSGRVDKVYPRVCGGTRNSPPILIIVIGLSPRVRGNPHGGEGDVVGVRSIPACAGEPHRHIKRAVRQTVYPRVCGGT